MIKSMDDARHIAEKLIEGVGWAADEVGKAIEYLGREIDKLGKAVAGRILTAAEKGDIEELTAAAEDLKERSDAYTPFSEKLVELAEDFDFEVIGELVSELEQSANI